MNKVTRRAYWCNSCNSLCIKNLWTDKYQCRCDYPYMTCDKNDNYKVPEYWKEVKLTIEEVKKNE